MPVRIRSETLLASACRRHKHCLLSSDGQSARLVNGRFAGSTPAGGSQGALSACFRGLESLAIRLVRDEEIGGSNPSAPKLLLRCCAMVLEMWQSGECSGLLRRSRRASAAGSSPAVSAAHHILWGFCRRASDAPSSLRLQDYVPSLGRTDAAAT